MRGGKRRRIDDKERSRGKRRRWIDGKERRRIDDKDC